MTALRVWLVSPYGRHVDRVCDSLATGQSVCDDLLRELTATSHEVVEDWQNLNVPEALPRWVRYVREAGSDEAREQIVAAADVDTTGRWFRRADTPTSGGAS